MKVKIKTLEEIKKIDGARSDKWCLLIIGSFSYHQDFENALPDNRIIEIKSIGGFLLWRRNNIKDYIIPELIERIIKD